MTKRLRLPTLPSEERDFLHRIERSINVDRPFLKEAKACADQYRMGVELIVSNPEKPDYHNTIELLDRLEKAFYQVRTDFDGLICAKRVNKLKRIESQMNDVYDRVEADGMTDNRMAERVRQVFYRMRRGEICRGDKNRRAREIIRTCYNTYLGDGYYLPSDKREELILLKRKLSKLEIRFGKRSSNEVRTIFFRNGSDLAGLTTKVKKRAAAEAAAVGKRGWLLHLEPTSYQKITKQLVSEKAKRRVYQAVRRRGRCLETLILEISKCRLQIAKILGYESWSDIKTSEGGAGTPRRVWDIFSSLDKARDLAAADIRTARRNGWRPRSMDRLSLISYLPKNQDGGKFRPQHVLENGCFFAAERLFGLRFSEVRGFASYDSKCALYKVEQRGKTLGFLLFDLYKRAGKASGAWAYPWENTQGVGRWPFIGVACSFEVGQRIGMDDVVTLFHEFGHALHGLFTSKLPGIFSGLDAAHDFVEAPSQLAEHWAYDPAVYRSYASEGGSRDVPSKIVAGKGIDYMGVILSAGADLLWHGPSAHKYKTCRAVDKKAQNLVAPGLTHAAPRYRSTYFEHIFRDGYDACYYSYLWSELLAGKIQRWVKLNGGLNRKTGQALLRYVYKVGANAKAPGSSPLWRRFKKRLFVEN